MRPGRVNGKVNKGWGSKFFSSRQVKGRKRVLLGSQKAKRVNQYRKMLAHDHGGTPFG